MNAYFVECELSGFLWEGFVCATEKICNLTSTANKIDYEIENFRLEQNGRKIIEKF